jgi:hypothetical protein
LGQRVDQIILAWGNGGSLQGRDRYVMALLGDQPIYCLGTTKLGQPRHPLYLRREVARHEVQLSLEEDKLDKDRFFV